MNISIQSEGRRHYIIGDTFPIRDSIKNAGCKWDPTRKAWWTGKKELAEKLATTSSDTAPASDRSPTPKEAPGEGAIVAGKATYKGKTYYIAGRIDRGRTQYDDA